LKLANPADRIGLAGEAPFLSWLGRAPDTDRHRFREVSLYDFFAMRAQAELAMFLSDKAYST